MLGPISELSGVVRNLPNGKTSLPATAVVHKLGNDISIEFKINVKLEKKPLVKLEKREIISAIEVES